MAAGGGNNDFDVDTVKPTLGNVAVDTATIYDTDLIQQVTLLFSEEMDGVTNPTITLGTTTGVWTSNSDGVWSVSTTTWVETYTITDANEEVTGVDVVVSGAKDVFGNTMDEDSATGVDEFDVDTKNPTAIVTTTVNPIYEGSLTQTVIVTYDEAMNVATTPVITLTGGNWGAQSGNVWSTTTYAGDTLTATFTQNGTEERIAAEVATVASASGATDAAGNTEIGDSSPAFVVDTQKPTVSSVSPTTLAEADAGTVNLDITFSEDMTQTDIVTVTVAGITGSPIAVTYATWTSATVWQGTFTFADNDEATDTAYYTIAGAKDESGNTMTALAAGGGNNDFDVDTVKPTIVDVNSNKADDDYTIGEVIDINVTFSESVSSAEVTIILDTGGSCTTTVTATDTATCNYTVGVGETSADLDATVGGLISDTFGNLLASFTPATTLADNKAIVIDTTDPEVDVGADLGLVVQQFTQNATTSDGGSGIATYAWTSTGSGCDVTFGTATAEDTTVRAGCTGYYTIRLTVTDNAGNSAYDELSFSWGNAEVPIVGYSPTTGALNVAIAAGTATIEFGGASSITLVDETLVDLIDEASSTSKKTAVVVRGGDGTSKYLDISYSGLIADKAYKIIITQGAVRNASGYLNSTGVPSYFYTGNGDVTPPTIYTDGDGNEVVYPSDGATDVSVSYIPEIWFSEVLDQTTITSTTVKLYNSDDVLVDVDPIFGIVAQNDISLTDGITRTVVQIIPDSNLDASTTYYVTISGTVTDLAGNAFAGWVKGDYSFTTAEEAATPTGDLSIDQVRINPLKSYALATDDFDDGWEWLISLTIPTDESFVQLKFSNFQGTADSIAAATNTRFFSEQSTNIDSTTTAITVAAANDYGALFMVFDASSDTQLGSGHPGWQVVVKVQVKVPTTAAGGAYSAQFSVQSSTP